MMGRWFCILLQASLASRVNSQYADRLRIHWQAENTGIMHVRIEHRPEVPMMPERPTLGAYGQWV